MRKLTSTSETCLLLSKLLPYELDDFSIYFDNYFSNVALFATLRELSIGTCGIARANTLPEALRINKEISGKEFDWGNTIAAIEGNVLCRLWQDNNTVFVMSTIHDFKTDALANKRRSQTVSSEYRCSFTSQDIEGSSTKATGDSCTY